MLATPSTTCGSGTSCTKQSREDSGFSARALFSSFAPTRRPEPSMLRCRPVLAWWHRIAERPLLWKVRRSVGKLHRRLRGARNRVSGRRVRRIRRLRVGGIRVHAGPIPEGPHGSLMARPRASASSKLGTELVPQADRQRADQSDFTRPGEWRRAVGAPQTRSDDTSFDHRSNRNLPGRGYVQPHG